MSSPDVTDMLHRAQESLTAAITRVEADREAAVDDMIAARLLIATALLTLQQTALVG